MHTWFFLSIQVLWIDYAEIVGLPVTKRGVEKKNIPYIAHDIFRIMFLYA